LASPEDGRGHTYFSASFYQGQAVLFDWQEFFKTQIEECRELERQAVNREDRVFWRQAVERWEEQLRQAIRQDKEDHSARRKREALSTDV
jgi:hypothetical protein